MVKKMIKNGKLYKGCDILNNSYNEKINSYFDPFEFNLEKSDSNFNSDLQMMKSKSHSERKIVKK